MKLFGNILWLIGGGLIYTIVYFLLGVICCVTLVGIPFGLQNFKCAKLAISPFGKRVDCGIERHPILNVIWLVPFGLIQCVLYAIFGAVFCVTIIGIPFALQCFKFARLTFAPFGGSVY